MPVDENNELVFCHNEIDKNEFFGPLIEKAYAKFVGSYGLLDGGFASVSMTDLTGAGNIIENIENSFIYNK